MKRLLLLLLVCGMAWSAGAQGRKYSTFYYQRATLFEALPASPQDIIFLGNSITNGAEWSELLANPRAKNRGISGDTTMGVYDRLDAILKGKPAKIFLMIGINDVNQGIAADSILRNMGMIVAKIKKDSPRTRLYVQSVLPVTEHYNMFKGHTSRGALVPQINDGLQKLANEEKVTYVDVYTPFLDAETGKLDIDYTNDGLHLLGNGYLKWAGIIKPYVDER